MKFCRNLKKIFSCYLFLTAGLAAHSPLACASIFGEETAVLLNVLANQLTELQKLSDSVGIAKNQRDFLVEINDGVQKTTQQINSIQDVMERVQGVDPTSIRSLSQLNQSIDDLKYASGEIQQLLIYKLTLCDEAVEEAGIQSDTAYRMGQEMADLGAKLSEESKTASPGRAQQISAAAASSQMLAVGVELQTLSHVSQLLAMSLDLQKAQMEKELKLEQTKRSYMKSVLAGNREDFSNHLSHPAPKRKVTKL